MKLTQSHILIALSFILSACSNDPYDTGDGSLSHMRADFVEAQTDASANIISIETDDGEHMFLTNAINVSWAERPDTIYRALLYYNKELYHHLYFQGLKLHHFVKMQYHHCHSE